MAVVARLANFVAKQISSPSAPPSGSNVLYPKSDNKWYSTDSLGYERELPDFGTVRVATTGAITLSGTQTIDGVNVVAGDRVLVRSQGVFSGNTYDNGIWVVAAGAWTRATDADTAAKIAGRRFYVTEGTKNIGQILTCTFKATDTLGTTALAFYRTRIEVGTTFEQPLNADQGHVIFNASDRLLGVWTAAGYLGPKGIQDYGTTAPPYPKTGETWFDATNDQVKVYDGTAWITYARLDDDADWIAPTLTNSWVNFGGAFATAGYRKRNGMVYLKGTVKNGTGAVAILTLPAGYRPAAQRMFAATGSTNTGAASAGTAHTHPVASIGARVDVYADGQVIQASGTNAFLSLDNVCFPAEA